jgi:hypothetical protein
MTIKVAERKSFDGEFDFLVKPSADLKWFDIMDSNKVWGKYVNTQLSWSEEVFDFGSKKFCLFVWWTTPYDPFTRDRVHSLLKNMLWSTMGVANDKKVVGYN